MDSLCLNLRLLHCHLNSVQILETNYLEPSIPGGICPNRSNTVDSNLHLREDHSHPQKVSNSLAVSLRLHYENYYYPEKHELIHDAQLMSVTYHRSIRIQTRYLTDDQ